MFKVFVNYPSYEEEYTIAERTTATLEHKLDKVLTRREILDLQRAVRRVPAAPQVMRHALDLVRGTRPPETDSPDFVTGTGAESGTGRGRPHRGSNPARYRSRRGPTSLG